MNLVILTATVTPNVAKSLLILDPADRLKQYQSAVSAWQRALRSTEFQLAIVETSGSRGDEFFANLTSLERSNVDFFSFKPTPDQVVRGKGAIESAAIEYAISAHGGLSKESTIYKCTGRLRLENVDQCIQILDQGEARVRMTLDRSWADTRLFGATLNTWTSHLFDTLGRIDDDRGVYYERFIAAQVASGVAMHEVKLSRFRTRPVLAGVSGSMGTTYSPRIGRARNVILGPVERLLISIASRKQV